MADTAPTALDLPVRPARLPALDIARSGALLAMGLYHFVFDLQLFGLLAPGTATTGAWRVLALCTAGSFLALAGVSLWLAHGTGIRWRAFWRRFGMVAGAALLISLATYVAMPESFIFFGILHGIAVCSLLGLACLRLPVPALLALAMFVFWAPTALRADLFNAPLFWPLGLRTRPLVTMDYIPIFPWFGPFLIGLAAARLATRFDLWPTPPLEAPSRMTQALAWPGRHSLVIYLLHQPVLIGLIWLVLQIP